MRSDAIGWALVAVGLFLAFAPHTAHIALGLGTGHDAHVVLGTLLLVGGGFLLSSKKPAYAIFALAVTLAGIALDWALLHSTLRESILPNEPVWYFAMKVAAWFSITLAYTYFLGAGLAQGGINTALGVAYVSIYYSFYPTPQIVGGPVLSGIWGIVGHFVVFFTAYFGAAALLGREFQGGQRAAARVASAALLVTVALVFLNLIGTVPSWPMGMSPAWMTSPCPPGYLC